MLELQGQRRCGAMSLLADGQCGSPRGSSGQWDFLPPVCAVAGSPCRGQQQEPCSPSLAVTWQQEQPLRGFAAAQWFAKISFGHHCFLPLPLPQSASVCDYRHRSASQVNENVETWGSSMGGKCLSCRSYPFT